MQDKRYLNQVKSLLKAYGEDKKRVYAKENAIKQIDNELDLLQAAWSSNEPTQGSGIIQEDKINKLLDRKMCLLIEVEELKTKHFELRYSLRQLDSKSWAIIYNVWIYGDCTIRKQAKDLYISKSAFIINLSLL